MNRGSFTPEVVKVIVVAMTVASACDDDADPADPADAEVAESAGGDDAAADDTARDQHPNDTGSVDAAPETADQSQPTVPLTLVPVDYFSEAPIVGLEICSLDVPALACVVTTAEGGQLHIPAARDQSFTVRGPRHLGTVYPLPGRSTALRFSFPVFSEEVAAAIAAIAGVTLDPTRGHLIVFVTETGATGSARVVGAQVEHDDGGDGPFYVAPDNRLIREPAATTGVGAAVTLNLPGDRVRVRVTHPERDCFVHGPGWPVDGLALDLSELPLVPGHVTHVQFRCPLP